MTVTLAKTLMAALRKIQLIKFLNGASQFLKPLTFWSEVGELNLRERFFTSCMKVISKHIVRFSNFFLWEFLTLHCMLILLHY